MAFTKKFLASLGIDTDKADRILEEHSAVTNLLKTQADCAENLKKQLALVNQKLAESEKNDYKQKYESVLAEHQDLVGKLEAEKIMASKSSAYRAALKKAGIPDTRIPAVLKVTDLGSLEFGENFQLKNEAAEIEKIKTEYSGLIPSAVITGVNPETPPAGKENNNGRTGIAAQLQKQYQETMYGSVQQ